MKLYTDKTPESCKDCGVVCGLYAVEHLIFMDEYKSKSRPKECPLQSLAEHDRELEKALELACKTIKKQVHEEATSNGDICWSSPNDIREAMIHFKLQAAAEIAREKENVK